MIHFRKVLYFEIETASGYYNLSYDQDFREISFTPEFDRYEDVKTLEADPNLTVRIYTIKGKNNG